MLDRRLALLALAAVLALSAACKNPHAAETPDPANLWLLMPEGGTGGVSYSNWERHLKHIDRRADELGRRFDAHHFFQWALGLAYQGFPGGRPSFPMGSPHGTNAYDGSGFFYDAAGEVVVLAWAIQDPGLAQQARRPHQASIREHVWTDGACELWRGFLVCADTSERLEQATARTEPVDGAAQARALGAKNDRALSIAMKLPSMGLASLFFPDYGVLGVSFGQGRLSLRVDYSATAEVAPRGAAMPHEPTATAASALGIHLTRDQMKQQLASARQGLPAPAIALLEQLEGTMRVWSSAGGVRFEAAVGDEREARHQLGALCDLLPTAPAKRSESSVCTLLVPTMALGGAPLWPQLYPDGLSVDLALRGAHAVVDIGHRETVGPRLAEPSGPLRGLLESDATVVFASRAFDLGYVAPARRAAATGDAPGPDGNGQAPAQGPEASPGTRTDVGAADIVAALGHFIPVTAGNVDELRAAAAIVMEVGVAAWFDEKGGGVELLVTTADADPPKVAELYYSALSARRMGKLDKHRERLERLATDHPDTLAGQRARAVLDGALGPRAGLLPLLVYTLAVGP